MPRRRRANGRRVEKDFYNNLLKAKPKWFIVRFNENRWNRTPADLFLSTPKYNVLVEVKSTITKFIMKHSVRPNQVKDLTHFQKIQKRNKSIVVLYYRGPKFVLMSINRLRSMKSRISYEEAVKNGVLVTSWKMFHRYLDRVK